MKMIALSVAFEVASRIALAHGAVDPMAHLRTCSSMQHAEQQDCLDKLPRSIEPADRLVQGGDNWVISETTSPVNYTPIVTATTLSRDGPDGSRMQLTIRCRSGRTELVVSGPALSSGGADHTLSYRINDSQPVQVGAGSPSFGTGTAFRGDVVPLLLSLPEEGGIAIRLSDRTGAAQVGHFSLSGLKAVRAKVAAACKWPGAVARPRNQ
ncbi:hypothetical protein [Bosea sp. (in: a-proteobacteria)]|uniref:hypothetical protein n=1 Tax=Bosea sp. (in: a-proteobacteria) TaxID=1871050 RepID=UPI002FCB08FA